MAKVRAIPEGYHTVTPFLSVNGAGDAIDFYKKAFGAEERGRMPGPDGKLVHGEIKIGDSVVMVADAIMGPPTTASIHLYVDDVDAAWTRATAAGRGRGDAARGSVLGRSIRRAQRQLGQPLEHGHAQGRPLARRDGQALGRGHEEHASAVRTETDGARRRRGAAELVSPFLRRASDCDLLASAHPRSHLSNNPFRFTSVGTPTPGGRGQNNRQQLEEDAMPELKVVCLLGQGFEDSEFRVPYDRLRSEGIQ